MTSATPDAHDTQDPQEAPAKPKRIGLFKHFPYGSIGAMAMTSAFLGLISLLLEVGVQRLFGSHMAPGWPGLQLPFVSAPLGISALLLSILLARHNTRQAIAPILSTAAYWLVALSFWLP